MKSRRAKPFLIILGFGAFAVLSILLKNDLRKDTSPLEQFPLGKPMPDFSLQDLQGKPFTLGKTGTPGEGDPDQFLGASWMRALPARDAGIRKDV